MKTNTIIIFFFTLFFHKILYASDSFIIRNINLGLQYSSLKERHGVIFYQDFQIDPVLVFEFINENIEFVGDAISFKKFIHSDQLLYRSQIIDVPNQPFFPINANIKKNFPHRQHSAEWSNRLEYYFPSYYQHFSAELDFEYDKDLIAHKGNYIAIESKLRIFSYKKIEPNLFSSLAAGDKKHNNYYYGADSKNFSLNNFTVGLNILAPQYVDRYFALAKIHYFQVLGNQNKDAFFAKNKNHGMFFMLALTKNIN